MIIEMFKFIDKVMLIVVLFLILGNAIFIHSDSPVTGFSIIKVSAVNSTSFVSAHPYIILTLLVMLLISNLFRGGS